MKKITFLMLHMGFGGIESAISNQANMLCNDFEVEIVSIYKLKYAIPYEINKKVNIKFLSELETNKEEFKKAIKSFNIVKTLKEGFKAIKILYLKKKLLIDYIKQCESDVIISTRCEFNKFLGKYGKKDKVKVAQEHVHHKDNEKYINKLVNSVHNIDYLMPVSSELTKFYSKRVSSRTKCVYIKHALDFKHEKYNYKKTNNLIAVARLSKEKGFSDLLDVISIISKSKKDICLNLIGDGVEKENLKQKIKELKLEKNVIMHGYKKRPEVNDLLKESSIYCMTSFEESFGLSVIEAMAFGLPCVAFDDAKGVLEIIDKKTGIVIKNRDKEKMSQEIIDLLKSNDKIIDMSKKAYEKSLDYSTSNIQKEWIKFYNEVSK